MNLAVEKHGFNEKASRASGRATNLLVAAHSAAGLYFADAAVKHAGVCVACVYVRVCVCLFVC